MSEPLVGFVLVEPELAIERVPDYVLNSEDFLWPAHLNTLHETKPGAPTPLLNTNALYHRYALNAVKGLFVWTRRDAHAIPLSVTNAVVAAAKSAGFE